MPVAPWGMVVEVCTMEVVGMRRKGALWLGFIKGKVVGACTGGELAGVFTGGECVGTGTW